MLLYSQKDAMVSNYKVKCSGCLVSDAVKRGDIIVSLDGSNLPFALRERQPPSQPSEFQFLGPTLTEYKNSFETGDFQSVGRETFTLV